MKSFAFNFRANEDENRSIVGTFSFEPENIYEKKSGNLYMLGLLANSLPQDQPFLSDLALQIKNTHYKSEHKTIERALNDSLQDANEYLKNLIKSNRVGWMGNLNFAVFALRNRDFLFAKTGSISIMLLRAGTLIDLDQDLKDAAQPQDPQVFGNLVSGKLQDGDAILATTADIGAFIKKYKISKEIASIVSPSEGQEFDINRLERAFEIHKLKMASLEGSCLLISLRSDLGESGVREFRLDNGIKKVSLRAMFSSQRSAIRASKLPRISFAKSRGIPWAKIAVSVIILGAVATGGLLFYSAHRAKTVAGAKEQIQAVADKISTIASLQNSGQSQQARDLLNSTAAELESIKKTSADFMPQVAAQISQAQSAINSSMSSLNGMQAVTPAVVFRFTDFNPARLALNGSEIIVFDPKFQGIYSISGDKAKHIDSGVSFDSAVSSENSIILFTRPNLITEYKNGAFLPAVKLGLPYANASFDDLGIYSGNLYFVDRGAGNLIKYLRLGKSYSLPQSWLAGGLKINANEVSLAFDRNAWILNRDGSIDKYFAGARQESLKPSYWPQPQTVTRIWTENNLDNLYVLDGDGGRIIIISKTGQFIKQLVSGQMKGAFDLVVQNNGQEILVLTPDQLLSINN